MNTGTVDSYLRDGCGRCDDYRTPACKVHRWTAILEPLREVLLAAGLVEEMKWGSPCYTLGGRNVAMLASFRESCALSFLEGATLHDPDGALELPGPNSRRARLLRFRDVEQARALGPIVARIVDAAVAQARAGRPDVPAAAPAPDPLPVELEARLAADPALRAAFDALTPGRRRSHALRVGGAALAETRARRAERCAPLILAGKGADER